MASCVLLEIGRETPSARDCGFRGPSFGTRGTEVKSSHSDQYLGAVTCVSGSHTNLGTSILPAAIGIGSGVCHAPAAIPSVILSLVGQLTVSGDPRRTSWERWMRSTRLAAIFIFISKGWIQVRHLAPLRVLQRKDCAIGQKADRKPGFIDDPQEPEIV
jgi:hypothetical protein